KGASPTLGRKWPGWCCASRAFRTPAKPAALPDPTVRQLAVLIAFVLILAYGLHHDLHPFSDIDRSSPARLDCLPRRGRTDAGTGAPGTTGIPPASHGFGQHQEPGPACHGKAPVRTAPELAGRKCQRPGSCPRDRPGRRTAGSPHAV